MADGDQGDRVVRAMTADGAFRIIAAMTADTANQAAAAQGAAGADALRLAELLTGAVLLREAMSPGHRLQIIFRDAGGGTVIADALPDGVTRGLINPGSDQPLDAAQDATIEVSRTLANGQLHQGVVSAPAGSNVSTALMRYLQESEQIYSVIAVGTLAAGDRVGAAGGYLVQLLPDVEQDALELMTSKLGDAEPLDGLLASHSSADELLATVMGDIEHQILLASAIRFGCTCSRDRIMAGLATLEPAELREMIDAGKELDIRCDACGRHYSVKTAELEPLLSASRG